MTRTETGGRAVDTRYWLNRAQEALGFPASFSVAAVIQTKSFYEMRQDNTIGNDKYFHCVANCQSSRAAGTGAACAVAGAREDSQEMTSWHNEDRRADEAANAFGRNAASGAVHVSSNAPNLSLTASTQTICLVNDSGEFDSHNRAVFLICGDVIWMLG